jgi:hypothetical protein
MFRRLTYTDPASGRCFELGLGDRVRTWEGEGEVMTVRPQLPGMTPRFTVRFGHHLATIGLDEVTNLRDFARS